MVKYAEVEWKKKLYLTPEERVLLNPLDPIYKELLHDATYEEKDIVAEIEKRLEGKTELYDPPQKEALYQLFPLVSVARKGSYSQEAHLVMKTIVSAVRERLSYALENPRIEQDVINAMSGILTVETTPHIDIDIPREDAFRLSSRRDQLKYMVNWTVLTDYDLTTYYIVEGSVPLTKDQLIEVYILLLGKHLKTYIDQKKEEYTSQDVHLPPIFKKLFQSISSRVPTVSVQPTGASELDESAFPPCVREALHGATSGLRNYAITVLLTSFLSYARVYPSLTAFDQEKKPELSPEQVEILLEEVAPLIIDAGNRCDPPLFADQPIERLNVYYHMGFGLNDSPGQNDFGTSKWYLPPSCKKIQQNAPSLCKPDALCSRGIYVVADRERLEHLITTNTGSAQRVLLAVRKSRNPQRIAEVSGADENDVNRILRNLEREDILIQIRVKNPLVYYVRKVRRKRRRRRQTSSHQ